MNRAPDPPPVNPKKEALRRLLAAQEEALEARVCLYDLAKIDPANTQVIDDRITIALNCLGEAAYSLNGIRTNQSGRMLKWVEGIGLTKPITSSLAQTKSGSACRLEKSVSSEPEATD
jgi:hypothetical protein